MAVGPGKYRTLGQPMGRPPLRTFNEMAESFGLTPAQLIGEMAQSKIAHPKPVTGVAHTRLSRHNSYYDIKPLRIWWKRHLEIRIGEILAHTDREAFRLSKPSERKIVLARLDQFREYYRKLTGRDYVVLSP